MKRSIFLSLMLILTLSIGVNAQETKTEEFKVYGNCGMCKNRIETATKSLEGVINANWNKDTKIIKVSFDSLKTNFHQIQMAINKAGHDTEMNKATDEAYNNLPSCCQYKRKDDK